MIKKILFTILLNVAVLSAQNNINTNGNIAVSINSINKSINSDKKTYSDLINALSASPKAEHSFLLGILYLNGSSIKDSVGKIVKPDINKALQYFNKAISLGDVRTAYILGSFYIYHDKLKNKKDSTKKAIDLLKYAIARDYYEATVPLANIYATKLNNQKQAIKWLKLGAVHDVASAQLALAFSYNYGVASNDHKSWILKKDKKLANILLTKACLNKKKPKEVKDFCENNPLVIIENKK